MKLKFLLYLLVFISYSLRSQPPIQWQKTFGGSNDDDAESIQQTKDGGYIFAGSTLSNDDDVTTNHGSYDCWVVKLKADSSIQWQKSFGGTDFDVARCIQQTTDGGFIFTGLSDSNDNDQSDCWVVKIDSAGNIEWQKSFGGSSFDAGNSIRQTFDKGYIVADSLIQMMVILQAIMAGRIILF